MKKLIAFILAALMLTAAITPAYAETGTEPEHPQDVLAYDWEAVETLIDRIKVNATSGNGDASWPSWRWKVELPNAGDREIWLGFSCMEGKEQQGTLSVLIRTPDAVYYLWRLCNVWEHTQVNYCSDTTLPDEYIQMISENQAWAETRSGNDYDYISGEILTREYTVGTAPWRNLSSNIENVKNSPEYAALTEEICWLIDAWQFCIEDEWSICNLGFLRLAGIYGTLCRFHVWTNPVNIGNGNTEYTCSRCGHGTIVHTPRHFNDVPEDAYYAPAVDWAVENGVTNGTSDSTFSPNAKCTRAQIVTFLWAAAGKPEMEPTDHFSDVPDNAWYAEAVSWAYAEGITNGTGRASFSPNKVCTRAEIVTMLWRANGSPESDTQTRFADVHGWYEKAVAWAVENGITAGTRADTFSPDQVCTRAQAVTFIWKGETGNGN